MEVKGKVIAVPPMAKGMGATGEWKRQTVVIEFADGQYTTKLALENKNKADEFAKLTIGTTINAKYAVSSREFNGKWFTTATCYSWTVEGAIAAAKPADDDMPV